MSPQSTQKSAKRPDADLCRRHNSVTVPYSKSALGKVGVLLRSPPSNHQPTKPSINGNPHKRMRLSPRRNRSAPVGLPAIQDRGSPLKGASSATDVKMPPSGRSDGDARHSIFIPTRRHATGSHSCCGEQNASNRSEMNIGQIRSSPFSLYPNMWHGCCLSGGCHGH